MTVKTLRSLGKVGLLELIKDQEIEIIRLTKENLELRLRLATGSAPVIEPVRTVESYVWPRLRLDENEKKQTLSFEPLYMDLGGAADPDLTPLELCGEKV